MSVIVYNPHHNANLLASDSFSNNGDIASPYPKLWSTATTIYGVVGPLQGVAQLQQWVADGMKPGQFPSQTGAQLLVLDKQKGLRRYKNSATPYLHGKNILAIGEGAPYAYGAMFMGATAEQAVAAAIRYCIHCNGDVQTLSLP